MNQIIFPLPVLDEVRVSAISQIGPPPLFTKPKVR